MCGLVGAVGTLEYKHKRVMQDLLFLDTLRGRDSTGLAAVRRNRDVVTRKMTIPGYEFIEHPAAIKMMEHHDQLWIGHNRFKTTGEISRQNAHPFEVLDEDGSVLLVGAHNGTLENKFEIERFLDDKYDTDSEGLFNLLVKAPNFKEAVAKLRGAWSLVFWDATKDTINFIRNKERPLVFAYSKDKRVMFWASEGWMLVNAARRNDVDLATNDKGFSCFSTAPDHLYSMEIPQRINVELPMMEGEGGYSGAPSSRFQHPYGAWENWWNGLDEDPDDEVKFSIAREKQEEEKERKEKAAKADAEDEKKILTLGYPNGTRRGFEGHAITQKIFDEVKANGCVWCKDPIERVYAFIDERAMICQNCLSDMHPKGGCVLSERGEAQAHSAEYKKLIADASAKATS